MVLADIIESKYYLQETAYVTQCKNYCLVFLKTDLLFKSLIKGIKNVDNLQHYCI